MTRCSTDPFSGDFVPSMSPSLYPLKMEGKLEAPEGLLSWVVGLAQAHCLGPRTLIKHLLSEHEQYREIWSGSAFFERDSGTVNGLGSYAQMMSDILGAAGSQSVTDMTLLPLSHLFPRNGEGLLAKRPRWCPACVCEQARSGRRLHFPLVWSLEYYRACHIHRTMMNECCPACGSQQTHLPSYPSLVHCYACGEPLLAQIPACADIGDLAGIDFECWCSEALVDLVARREELRRDGALIHFRRNIEDIVARFSPGNRKALCERIGLQIYALNGWINKGERPSIAVLLRLGYGVGILPGSMFVPNAVGHARRSEPISALAGEREDRPLLGYRQRERIDRQLNVILNDPSDSRGLAAVGHQVGLSRHALKYWFERQSREIVRRNRLCESRRLEDRYKEDHEFLRAIVQSLRAEGIYPSRRRVNAGLAVRRISLMRPDIHRAYEQIRRSQACFPYLWGIT